MSRNEPKRIVVFGATGHLGQQIVEKLAESNWPISELLGVASPNSAGAEFEFRGEMLDVVAEWPLLKGRDLVMICTPKAEALEIVREALRAEVPVIDCSGALAEQDGVPMPNPLVSAAGNAEDAEGSLKAAPLVSVPAGTTLAWAPVLDAVGATRVVGTAICSASSQGQKGVTSLSQESIALFNQSDPPDSGPAGQTVAFDVIPGGGIDSERVRADLARIFGSSMSISLASVQVPTFVGEGASLLLELKDPLSAEAFEARLAKTDGILLAQDGVGSRGLAAVEEEAGAEPIGPTLRDAIGSDEILVGRVEPDASMPVGEAWRLWLAFDPLRLAADEAIRIAERRLGLA